MPNGVGTLFFTLKIKTDRAILQRVVHLFYLDNEECPKKIYTLFDKISFIIVTVGWLHFYNFIFFQIWRHHG